MTLLLIILVIFTIGYFMVNIYRHDNSTFYKLTSYSYLDLLTSKKIRTLYKLVGVLDQVNGTHKILVNIQVPVNDALKTIDAMLLHESGIYVMNIRAKSGWINGRERDHEWKELLHKGKSRTFSNPIHETKRLMFALRDQLAEVDEHAFQSVVLFTDDCSFQQIEIQSDNVEVLKMKDLKKWTSSIKGNVISETDIQTLFVTLEGSMSKKNAILKADKTVSV
ncbi:nuclease-related domain-containing protein [Solibacillus daqui]|uniref:nuclease-related domain-containing protein n=1 Tax=Solibacillus daqui TaxID=2912187 RepID=UPI002366C18D|nr:nuclease-related domain-containing protein [Solibacillus daqui]